MKDNRYEIFLDDVLIGVAMNVGPDMPRYAGTFEPTPAFASVQSLFEQEYAALARGDEWRTIMNQIFARGLRLESKRTGEVFPSTPGKMPCADRFIDEIAYLHIQGEKVWWRLM